MTLDTLLDWVRLCYAEGARLAHAETIAPSLARARGIARTQASERLSVYGWHDNQLDAAARSVLAGWEQTRHGDPPPR